MAPLDRYSDMPIEELPLHGAVHASARGDGALPPLLDDSADVPAYLVMRLLWQRGALRVKTSPPCWSSTTARCRVLKRLEAAASSTGRADPTMTVGRIALTEAVRAMHGDAKAIPARSNAPWPR